MKECSTCERLEGEVDALREVMKDAAAGRRVAELQARVQKLEAAIQMWAQAFYCDGETREKAIAKLDRFNQFTAMVNELGIRPGKGGTL